jgi:hypothetical protein
LKKVLGENGFAYVDAFNDPADVVVKYNKLGITYDFNRELAEMLREVIRVKINRCKREIRDCTITITDRILAQIVAYRWVQSRILDIIISNEVKIPRQRYDIDGWMEESNSLINNLNLNLNTARAPNIKHNSPEVKDVCYFAGTVPTKDDTPFVLSLPFPNDEVYFVY